MLTQGNITDVFYPVGYLFRAIPSQFALHFELRDLFQELNTPGICFMTQI